MLLTSHMNIIKIKGGSAEPPLRTGLICSCHYHIHMSIITQDGDTALMLASREGKTEVVDQLINAGATLDLQDKVCISCYVVVSHDV